MAKTKKERGREKALKRSLRAGRPGRPRVGADFLHPSRAAERETSFLRLSRRGELREIEEERRRRIQNVETWAVEERRKIEAKYAR